MSISIFGVIRLFNTVQLSVIYSYVVCILQSTRWFYFGVYLDMYAILNELCNLLCLNDYRT